MNFTFGWCLNCCHFLELTREGGRTFGALGNLQTLLPPWAGWNFLGQHTKVPVAEAGQNHGLLQGYHKIWEEKENLPAPHEGPSSTVTGMEAEASVQPSVLSVSFSNFYFETGSHYVAQTGLRFLVIFLPQLPGGWNYRYSRPAQTTW